MSLTATQFLKEATETAEHFGFRAVESLKKERAVKRSVAKLTHTISAQERRIDELSGLLTLGAQTFCDAKFDNCEAPVLFYTLERIPRTGEAAVGLHVFNVPKSIAEAILIQAGRSFLTNLGFPQHTVRINSLGDRDSASRYIRELSNFLRKHTNDLPDTARELCKEDSCKALQHLIAKDHPLAYRAPNPLEFLTDTSRRHFREIVEYLDLAQAPYEIDARLLGHPSCYGDALFAVDVADENNQPVKSSQITIRGGRYSEFVQRHTKKSIAAAGALFILHNKKAPARTPQVVSQTPAIAVIQLGFNPKIKSLLLVDSLRRENICVHQDLTSDSLSAQLRQAEAHKDVRYAVIIGQKEFLDDTVILRDLTARNQEVVRTSELIGRLKKVNVVV